MTQRTPSEAVKLTFWMNMPSFYQEDLFRALVDSGRVDLEVVYARDLDDNRRRLGWERDLGGYTSRVLTGRRLFEAWRIARAQHDRIHVVNGIWAVPAFTVALLALTTAGGDYLIYSEAPDPTVRLTISRQWLRATLGRYLASRTRGLLAISHFAADFYQSLGVPPSRVFPFGYFRKNVTPDDGTIFPRESSNHFELLFVGQVIPRKGVDLLIEAVVPLLLSMTDLRITLVGDGPSRPALEDQVRSLGIEERIRFEGVLGSDRIGERIARADALVLPSRWDGWGLVVNEALAAGVPVIVSDHCGASDLVEPGVNGYVFPTEDAAALRSCIEKLRESPDRLAAMKAAAARTGASLDLHGVASYLIDCLEVVACRASKKPVPPWQAPERQPVLK